MPDLGEKTGRTAGGVQSVHRALDLFEVVAARGGTLAIGEIAAAAGVPLPTTHRLLRTLLDRGYMRQASDRRYALGFPTGPSRSRRELVGRGRRGTAAQWPGRCPG